METNDEAKQKKILPQRWGAWHQQEHRDAAGMLLIGSTEMPWAGY